jgi:outer membrane protein assembly factor BamD
VAKQRLDRGKYEEAAIFFDEVERHPYSVWAPGALMSAFPIIWRRNIGGGQPAQRFLTIHPGNKDAPYANYLIAMSYYQQIEDVTRDRRSPNRRPIVQRADPLLSAEPLRDRRPAEARPDQRPSGWQGDGGWPFLPAPGQLAGGADCASARWSKSIRPSHTPEALERLVEISQPRPARRAHKAAAVLGANYPGSKWYERSYRLIQRHVPHSGCCPAHELILRGGSPC